MVVIVIRAQPKDSDEEHYSSRTRSYVVENPNQVFASSRCEIYDESESWPSSHDSELNANSENKLVNGNRMLCNKNVETTFVWHSDLDNSYVRGVAEKLPYEPTRNDHRLDSPMSKDSGFSDRITTNGNKTKNFNKLYESDSEKFLRQGRFRTSPLTAQVNCRNVDNNNTVAYLSCSSQVDPEDSITTTKEGKQKLILIFYYYYYY